MKNIVVIGGGTGTYTVLSGLKKYTSNLTAIVTMADDGGSSGELRDELGVLPPGDIRQCLVALSKSSKTMRQLLNYRFDSGKLKGHSFGNLFLSALEKVTGNFDKAVEEASQILNVSGKVIPVTLKKVQLCALLKDGQTICGENNIQKTKLWNNLQKIRLIPSSATINPKAKQAIEKADLVIIGPGNIYGSIIPNLLVKGVKEAIKTSRAKKVFVCNIMTKKDHTDDFQVSNFLSLIEEYLGKKSIDYVIFNTKRISGRLVKRYAQEGEHFVGFDLNDLKKRITPIPANLINQKIIKAEGAKQAKIADKLKRTLIRHNSDKLAKILLTIVK